MKCVRCGSIIPDDSKSCEFCGKIYQKENTYEKMTTVAEKEIAQLQFDEKHDQSCEDIPEKSKAKKSLKSAVLLGAAVGLLAGIATYYKGQELTGIDFHQTFEDVGLMTAADQIKSIFRNGNGKASDSGDNGNLDTAITDNGSIMQETESPEGESHYYELFLEDCSWSEAFQKCLEKGGHLVRFETEEELLNFLGGMDSDSNAISEEYRAAKYYIGGRRDLEASDYYWADESNNLSGDVLNGNGYWLDAYWMEGEPSLQDGDFQEHCMNLMYYQDEWIINDVPDNILSVMPTYTGAVGYICEYGN